MVTYNTLAFIEYSHAVLFLLDSDVRERRNVVYLLTFLKNVLNAFKKSFLAFFLYTITYSVKT